MLKVILLNDSADYEIRSLTTDFDKVARKQMARLKKQRNDKLRARLDILIKYGYKSRERICNFTTLT